MNLSNLIHSYPVTIFSSRRKIVFFGMLLLFTVLTIFYKSIYRLIKKKLIESLYLLQDEKIKNEEKTLQARLEELSLNNCQLKDELEKKESLITTLTFKLTQKNELTATIKKNIQEVHNRLNGNENGELIQIMKLLKNEEDKETEWEDLKTYMEEVHGDFIQRLKSKFPAITSTDLKLCIYLKMNLTSKEIARLSNLTIRGIEASRYRLRKKLNIDSDTNLTDFILSM